MPCPVTRCELGDQRGDVLRALDRGERVVVTLEGEVVGELTPVGHGPFVDREAVLRVFAGTPAVDAWTFADDVDQDPTPTV
ncbi:hypothetical protein [Patulibacter americanus]|uniref:hypothetical protein n=1 Tax=Patulibacter americanus TaxID=588672 RepID=UPI0003B7979E|nr:hypothetical protein [Patulibacter americanus]